MYPGLGLRREGKSRKEGKKGRLFEEQRISYLKDPVRPLLQALVL